MNINDYLPVYYFDDSFYYKVRDIATYIGLSKGVSDRLISNVKKDIILQNYVTCQKVDTAGGKQDCLLILCNMLYMLLCKMFCGGFNSDQLIKYKQLLDFSSNLNHIISPDNRQIYSYESSLRDEIYDIGILNGIRIIEKEKTYNFGRIDLFGIDINKNKCCIELKKFLAYNYLYDQLKKYRDSGEFSRVVYLSYDYSLDIKEWCEQNTIEYYLYKRELVINRVV